MTVAQRLQALLKKKGFSVAAAAELAGLDRRPAWRVVTGKIKNPQLATVERIVYSVGGTMKELYEDED